MHVLNLTGGISTNSAEQTARRLKYYFPSHKITCGIFERENPNFTRSAAERGINTKFFGPSITTLFEDASLLPGVGYINSLSHALRTNRDFDLVHVYGGPLFHGPIGRIHSLTSRSPLVTRFNGYVPVPDSPIKRTIVRNIVGGLLESTRVVFNSHAQKSDTLSIYNVEDGEHIKVIPPGVDQRWFNPVDDTDDCAYEVGIGKNTTVLGSVLTPRPVKRLDHAFEIVSNLDDERNIEYVILGDSSYVDRYKRLSKEKGIEDIVHWVGHKDEDELAQWYSLFDVTILTSEWESFGMSITESYLCGTPCVAFDVGGMSDQIIDHETGRLVDPYDIDEFVTAVGELLDEKGANEFGERGLNYVGNRFTLREASKQYQEMVEEIASM